MYIYADVVFAINLVMNSVILLLTAWAADISYKRWRILLAAAAGSSYALIGILPGMMMLNHFIFKVTMATFLILLAFGFKPRRITLLLVTFFYVISFILGGAVIGWLYFWETNHYFGNFSWGLTNLSWIHLFFGSIAGILFILLATRRILVRRTRHNYLYRVMLAYEKQKVELTAMLDTGNGLYTVLGRKPVILVNQYAIEPMLSQQARSYLNNNAPEMWLANLHQCMDAAWLSKVQMIPYHSIGNTSMLLAFRLDHLIIRDKAGDIYADDVMVGIYSGTLSGDGAYDVLLHPQIMNQLSKKEEVSICA